MTTPAQALQKSIDAARAMREVSERTAREVAEQRDKELAAEHAAQALQPPAAP